MANIKKTEGSNIKNIITRLKRIEGQVKGIQKMVEEEKCCVDILAQIAAVRAAVNRVGGIILQNYSKECIKGSITGEDGEKAVENLLNTVQKFLKFVD